MNYSTLAAIDAYAVASGDYQFVESDNVGATAAINNVGGYTAGATSLIIDGISVASIIEKYSILYIGTEYLLVTAIPVYTTTTACTVVVSRAQFGSTAVSMLDDAVITIKDNRKIRCQNMATDDIINYTKISYEDDLFAEDSSFMIEAEKVQTIWINRHLEEREAAERIATIAQSNYADGVLTIGAAAINGLSKKARQLVDKVIQEIYGMQNNAFKRG